MAALAAHILYSIAVPRRVRCLICRVLYPRHYASAPLSHTRRSQDVVASPRSRRTRTVRVSLGHNTRPARVMCMVGLICAAMSEHHVQYEYDGTMGICAWYLCLVWVLEYPLWLRTTIYASYLWYGSVEAPSCGGGVEAPSWGGGIVLSVYGVVLCVQLYSTVRVFCRVELKEKDTRYNLAFILGLFRLVSSKPY